MKGPVFLAALVSLCLLAAVAPAGEKTPPGWFKAGNDPDGYVTGIDPTGGVDGKTAAFLEGKRPAPGKFSTLMQSFAADEYRGHRIRLSGSLKSQRVEGWAGLWMRVDGEGEQLAFDNMQNRAIEGTTDWQRYEIVLDVPPESVGIAMGLLMSGKGKVWMDDLKIEKVGLDVPVTDMMASARKKPANLDFEE